MADLQQLWHGRRRRPAWLDGLGAAVEDVLQRISEPDPIHGCPVVLSSDSLAQLQKCQSVQHMQPMRE